MACLLHHVKGDLLIVQWWKCEPSFSSFGFMASSLNMGLNREKLMGHVKMVMMDHRMLDTSSSHTPLVILMMLL